MAQFTMTDRENQTAKLELVKVWTEFLDDEFPDLSYLDQDYESDGVTDEEAETYRQQDARRLADYERGAWWMRGIKAFATVARKLGDTGSCQLHQFESAGIWGIESDSDSSFFDEMKAEQLTDLKSALEDFGVPVGDFDQLAKQ